MTTSRRVQRRRRFLRHLHRHLAHERMIAILWSYQDVQDVRPDLNADQAWEVLQQCHRSHGADIGLSWEGIEACAESLYPE